MPYRNDKLGQTMTEVAIELIEGKANLLNRRVFINLFKQCPKLIDDVAPEHHEALKKVLNETA